MYGVSKQYQSYKKAEKWEGKREGLKEWIVPNEDSNPQPLACEATVLSPIGFYDSYLVLYDRW